MENLIGKNVQILEEGIKIINHFNDSGVDNDFYTGQIVGYAGDGDWTIKINNKDVITYSKCFWSGVVSDRPDLIVLYFDKFEIL